MERRAARIGRLPADRDRKPDRQHAKQRQGETVRHTSASSCPREGLEHRRLREAARLSRDRHQTVSKGSLVTRDVSGGGVHATGRLTRPREGRRQLAAADALALATEIDIVGRALTPPRTLGLFGGGWGNP